MQIGYNALLVSNVNVLQKKELYKTAVLLRMLVKGYVHVFSAGFFTLHVKIQRRDFWEHLSPLISLLCLVISYWYLPIFLFYNLAVAAVRIPSIWDDSMAFLCLLKSPENICFLCLLKYSPFFVFSLTFLPLLLYHLT